MDALLRTHCVEPILLRTDNFETFFITRKGTLLTLIERAMGKSAISASESVAEDSFDQEDE